LITKQYARHPVRCPLLSRYNRREKRYHGRTDSGGQVSRPGIGYDDDLRAVKDCRQLGQTELASKINSLPTSDETGQRRLIGRSGNQHSMSSCGQRSHDVATMGGRRPSRRNRGTGMEYHIRLRANQSSHIGPSHIGQGPAYGKPGPLLVGNKAGSDGQREIALRLRQAIRHTMA
jgi:hypothetical protein